MVNNFMAGLFFIVALFLAIVILVSIKNTIYQIISCILPKKYYENIIRNSYSLRYIKNIVSNKTIDGSSPIDIANLLEGYETVKKKSDDRNLEKFYQYAIKQIKYEEALDIYIHFCWELSCIYMNKDILKRKEIKEIYNFYCIFLHYGIKDKAEKLLVFSNTRKHESTLFEEVYHAMLNFNESNNTKL